MNTPKNFSKLVDTVNFLNEYIPQIVTTVKNQLDPHIGKPIFTVNGSWRKSVNWQYEPVKKQLANGDWLSVEYYVQQQYRYVDLHIKVCLNGGSHNVTPSTAFTIYQRQSLTIYTVDDNGNIVDFDVDLTPYTEKYTVETIMTQANAAELKAKEYEAAREKVPYRFHDALYLAYLR
jgi:hypothetical protein